MKHRPQLQIKFICIDVYSNLFQVFVAVAIWSQIKSIAAPSVLTEAVWTENKTTFEHKLENFG